MHKADGRSFQQNSPAIYVLDCIISTNVDSQISHKLPDLGFPPAPYGKERQPLLMESFKTFLRCIGQMWGASDSICWPPMGHTVPYPPRSTLKLYTKYQDLGYPLSTANVMLYCNEKQQLLFGCFKIFLRCIRKKGEAADSIYQSFMLLRTMSFGVMLILNISQRISRLWDTLCAQQRVMLYRQGEASMAAGVFHNLP